MSHLLLAPLSTLHALDAVPPMANVISNTFHITFDSSLALAALLLKLVFHINLVPCAQAVAFGMGGGLLQKLNRDTLSFATKLSHVVYADGTPADIMKAPAGDTAKESLPGAAPRHPDVRMLCLACGELSASNCTTTAYQGSYRIGQQGTALLMDGLGLSTSGASTMQVPYQSGLP